MFQQICSFGFLTVITKLQEKQQKVSFSNLFSLHIFINEREQKFYDTVKMATIVFANYELRMALRLKSILLIVFEALWS